ncbi:Glycosyltransferase [Marinilactibacillus psychrotolerans 42ea]|uniref:Glycosyltransferase n=2 Tax=Marinilactibacillus psychrotolerans TaxID=191770 RepID=A0A1R4K131_9LACT|nr:Glycosyltransferase [Marinilactibacillus psychrotolerans 42ea]
MGEGKVHLINNGIDCDKFNFNPETRAKVRKALKVNDKFVVGHVGRFANEKNHSFLIDTFVEIYKEKNNSVLVLAGDGELLDSLKEKVLRLGIKNNVLFLGSRNDINEIMQAMDVFILPSTFEGLGIVAIEAQAVGLPCYVSDRVPEAVGITELVSHVSLKHSPKIWARQVLLDNLSNISRRSYIDEIKKNNYDVNDLSKWMETYYINLGKRNSM